MICGKALQVLVVVGFGSGIGAAADHIFELFSQDDAMTHIEDFLGSGGLSLMSAIVEKSKEDPVKLRQVLTVLETIGLKAGKIASAVLEHSKKVLTMIVALLEDDYSNHPDVMALGIDVLGGFVTNKNRALAEFVVETLKVQNMIMNTMHCFSNNEQLMVSAWTLLGRLAEHPYLKPWLQAVGKLVEHLAENQTGEVGLIARATLRKISLDTVD